MLNLVLKSTRSLSKHHRIYIPVRARNSEETEPTIEIVIKKTFESRDILADDDENKNQVADESTHLRV